MSRPEAALAGAIFRGEDGPVFPAPWAARAFALTVALHERGVFSWSEWAGALGAALRTETGEDPEAYWRAWMAALEEVLARQGVASGRDLSGLQQAWREAAERPPHGQVIELPARDHVARMERSAIRD